MRMFKSRAHHYERNASDARGLTVIAAELETPTGEHQPGVVLMVHSFPRLVLPIRDAINMATEIANIATEQK